LTPAETKILRAAARAARATGAVVGSHTIRGWVVKDQAAILEAEGFDLSRFIWIHAQAEPDFAIHEEMARRGVWIEYDNLGNTPDEPHIERIQRLLASGFADRILLSHDRGWFDPAKPAGGTPKPYTHLVETFLPKLRAAGVDEATIRLLTVTNPFSAFSR
jgi:phosphotriesterase-related protein